MKTIFFIILAGLLFTGCSSDPDSPLGADYIDDGLLGSRPGEVFQDTIRITSGDQSFFIGSRLDKNSTLSLGIKNNYQSSMILRTDFSGAGPDTARIVERALLTLRVTDATQIDSLTARFYELLTPYNEGDTLQSLDIDLTPIPDPDSGLTHYDRIMRFAIGQYSLPPDLVQDWIRGQKDHNGIAVVLEGPVTEKQLFYGSRENGESSLRPFLKVFFTGGVESSYSITDDGTFVEPITTTSNLILSDAYIRRILIPVDLTKFSTDVLIHDARLVLHVVPSTDLGSDFSVFLYAPNSDNPSDPDSWHGQGITLDYVNFVTGEVNLPVRNILLLFLGGKQENNGFCLRFNGEGSQIRQVEFYTSASDSLWPRIVLTASEAPKFDK